MPALPIDPPDVAAALVPFLGALLILTGCQVSPDIRLAQAPASTVSITEGRRHLEDGRADMAVTAFRQVLRKDRKDLQALNGLAIAYSELGREDLATEMFSRALSIAPNDAATLNNIGFSALRRADAMLARHYLMKAQSRNADLEEVEGNLARLAMLETIAHRPAFERSQRPGNIDSIPPVQPSISVIDFTTVLDPFAATARE